MESEVREFYERVWAGYQALLAGDPSRWARVSGEGSEDAVAERLWAVLEARGFLAGLADAGGARGAR